MMKEIFTHTVAIMELFKGFIVLNLVALPLTALMTFFITIMGASNPSKPGALYTMGIVMLFIYGIPLGVLLWLVGFGKVFDFVLRINPTDIATVSWFGLVLSAITIVAAGNIFVDHLYQFKQGNYGISIIALLITIGYVAVLYFSNALFRVVWEGMRK